jgi:hypothetical protein
MARSSAANDWGSPFTQSIVLAIKWSAIARTDDLSMKAWAKAHVEIALANSIGFASI